jgi:leader peptidase (prepilin peptidase) / N-methyltransferase
MTAHPMRGRPLAPPAAQQGSGMLARWSILISRRLATARTFEDVTIVIAGVAGIAASVLLLPDARGVAGGGLALLMIAIAVIDARRFIIPDELTIAALALGFAHAALLDTDAIMQSLATAALRGAVLAAAFWGLRIAYGRLRGREGIGLGDVKLAGVAGVWLDWATMPVAVEIAALAALAVYAVRRFRGGRSVRRTIRLPFGLFFAPAIWIGWLLESMLPLFPTTAWFP